MDLDDLARSAASEEQTKAGLGELASVIWAYRSQLVESGFTRDEAFELARDFHLSILERQSLEEDQD